MSELRHRVDDYLAMRRALGYGLRSHGRLLPDFADYLDEAGATAITIEHALAWATRPRGVQPYHWRHRLSVVRGFARYLHSLDATTEVPPSDLLAYRRQRPTPYLFSDSEIAALLDAAGALAPTLRAATYRMLFGLLAVTGMRVNEALHLERDDVDLDRGVLTIREAKFKKSRRLPLHESTVAALRAYARERDRLCNQPRDCRFFVSVRGTAPAYETVRGVFAALRGRAGLRARAGTTRPRIHDLRHSFAVSTLLGWYRDGEDVAARMPLLSAYLGHVGPASTYWYLQAAPGLLAAAAQRLEPGAQP